VVHPPVYLGPGATLEGGEVGPNVSIEAGASIKNSIISNTIVFDNARISDSTLSSSLVGKNATVRSFSGKVNIGDHSEVSG